MLKTFKWAATLFCCLMPALAAAQTPVELTAAMSQDISAPNRPNGFYTIEAKAPISPKLKVESPVTGIVCSAYNEGKLLAYSVQVIGGWRQVNYLATFDVETGAMSQKEVSSGATALAYDPLTKRYIGYSNQSQTIFEVNPETGEQTKLTSVSDIRYNGFAFNASGELYATSRDAESNVSLYKLDIDNNRTTLIGKTSISSNNPVRLAFDRKSGNLYAAVAASYGSKVFYNEINTTTGASTLIDTTESGQQVFALFFTNNTAENEDKAPGLPTDLKVTFKSVGSKSAELSAIAPRTAIDQATPLSNPMTLTFFIDDEKVGQKDNVSPGAKASINYTFKSEGVHWMRVETSNSHGSGLNAQTNTFVGLDTPDAVTNAILTIDANGNAKVSWTAPEHGANLGQFDPNALTYEVKVYPKNEVVATGLKGTSFSAKLPENNLYNYSYGITPVCGNLRGVETRTNYAEFGKGVRLPYVENFTTEDSWGLHRVIDENRDGTWERTLRGDTHLCRLTGGSNQAADWLFTPVVNMRKGVTYTLDFTVAASFGKTASMNVYLMDKVEVPYGGTEALTALTRMTFSDAEYTNGSVTVTAENDGQFRFVFYTNNYPNIPVNLYSYVISASSSDDSPADVSDLKVTPAERGALSATVSFKAPSTLKNGKPIAKNELTAIEIYKGTDKTPVYVFENPTPGAELSWTDSEAFHGRNSYVVACFSDLGNSNGVSANAWVGEDIADQVQNLRSYLDDEAGVINISWEHPAKGYQGGYIDYDNLTYSLSIFIAASFMEDYVTLKSDLKECRTTLSLSDIRQFLPQDVDGRASISILITPYTSAGAGRGCVTGVVIGEAYTLPFAESFAGLATKTDPWSVTTIYGSGSIFAVKQAPKASSLEGLQPQDHDGGMVMFFEQKAEYGEARFLGPQIYIGDAVDPILTFWMYHRTAPDTENNWLVIETKDAEGGYIEISKRFAVDGFGWQKHEVSLKEMCPADLTTIRLIFHGRAAGGVDFYFDNFTITDGQVGSQYPSVTDLKATLNDAEDEVTLTWSRPETGEYTLIGYYIYRDGVKVSNNYTTETTAKVAFPVDNRAHTFAIQAIYNEGDALLGNTVTVANSAIEGVDCSETRIFAEGNAVVIEAVATPYVIVNASGVAVATGTAEGRTTVELTPGIYIVKAGTATAKVAVR